ncbi:CG15382 [Drosophila busckii]|uniref:CG15382 n=1 Tax=Drosophila busckii TaxID=30019 RepID=A0A0M3QTT0_DROBS|nr:uncharacterized protein LOC108607574 [Drosophila busckii]ALC39419.1 CG15382 [Drosophila busckii]
MMKFTPNQKDKQSTKMIAETHGALELEAATALLMLRYQYDLKAYAAVANCAATQTPSPPPPAPAAAAIATAAAVVVVNKLEPAAADNCTPKEQVRTMPTSTQPLKKRSIPPHLLQRSLTPTAKAGLNQSNRNSSSSGGGGISVGVSGGGITKPKLKPLASQCNKALLKSCRNMIREFLDNQELI